MNNIRLFLSQTLSSGLDCGMVSAEDIIKHVTMDVLAHHLPVLHKTQLLEASLKADKMSAELVLETLGVEVMATHAPTEVLWRCVAECAQRALGGSAAKSSGAVTTPAPKTNSGAAVTPAPPGGPRLKPNSGPPTDEPSAVRKPNRPARAVGAGATSRSAARPSRPLNAPDEPSAFDVDTRVGNEINTDFEVLEETSDSDELLSQKS